MKTVQKIQKDKIFNENLVSQITNQSLTNQKNCQILHSGQVRFFMASALKKWPNFSKLVMKWTIWQAWHRRLSAVNSRKRNIYSCRVACCSLLRNEEERYCCITVIRYCTCTVYTSTERRRKRKKVEKEKERKKESTLEKERTFAIYSKVQPWELCSKYSNNAADFPHNCR